MEVHRHQKHNKAHLRGLKKAYITGFANQFLIANIQTHSHLTRLTDLHIVTHSNFHIFTIPQCLIPGSINGKQSHSC